MIRRTFEFLNEKNFGPLYKSLVRCHLDTASSVWHPYKKKHVIALENVQRRATKQLPGFKDLSYTERLKCLRLPSLAYRRERGDMIEVFKMVHGLYNPRVIDFLVKSEIIEGRPETTGHSHKLFLQQSNKDIRKYSFALRVVKVWNSLPTDVVNAPSIDAFKRCLDNYWANQAILYDFDERLTTGS